MTIAPPPARPAWALANGARGLSNAWIRVRHGRRPYRYLVVVLTGPLADAHHDSPLGAWLAPARPRLVDLVRLLEQAATDPLLEGVLLDVRSLTTGWAAIESLEEALDRVRAAGKTVHAFLESAGNLEYRLACSADRIHLHPTGTLSLIGLKAEVTLFGEVLERLGVHAELMAVGRYKSAAESFTRRQLSADAREALASLVSDLSAQLSARVSERRGLDATRLQGLIDAGPHLATEALAAGLVDRLCFRDELERHLVGEAGDPSLVRPRRYRKLRRRSLRAAGRPPAKRVAWIPIVGTIRSENEGTGRPFSSGGATAEHVVAALERARKAKLDAAVLRIDSPGGSGLASDIIWRAVVRLRDEIPVVVSMGNLAASGGYYVAAPAHRIVTAAGTLTGSIGVFGGKFEIGALYRKVGIAKQVELRGSHADIMSDARPFSPSERARIRAHLEHFYETFLARVSAGRGLERDRVHAVAQGRVWTGRQAIEHRLADRSGGILAAFEQVRELLEVAPDQALALVEVGQPNRWVRIARRASSPTALLSDWLREPAAWIELLRAHRPADALALLPGLIRIR